MHVSLVQRTVEKLGISTSTIDVLLVFDSKLHHKRFVFIGERFEFGGQTVKSGILAGLDSLVFVSISIKSTGSPSKFTGFGPFVR